MRVALKRTLSSRGNAAELFGPPPPRPMSYRLELSEARRQREVETKGVPGQGKTKLAIRNAYVNAAQLQASWNR
jgi:hypothetical protein